MTTPYKAIACSAYDVLEVAAMRKERLQLTTAEGIRDILITDVFARGKEEFLEGLDAETNTPVTLRLDSIMTIRNPNTGGLHETGICL